MLCKFVLYIINDNKNFPKIIITKNTNTANIKEKKLAKYSYNGLGTFGICQKTVVRFDLFFASADGGV